MKTTQLWPGVTVVNRSGRKIVVQWKELPDGTRMALLMGDNVSTVSGGWDEDEFGFFSSLLAAAPAIFSMAKKVAPGLMSTAGKLVSSILPAPAAKLLQGVLSPATSAAQKAIAQAPTAASAALPAAAVTKITPGGIAQQVPFGAFAQRPSRVKHLPEASKIPAGYRRVIPVSKVSEGAFID